jgi:hypothetical protein
VVRGRAGNFFVTKVEDFWSEGAEERGGIAISAMVTSCEAAAAQKSLLVVERGLRHEL